MGGSGALAEDGGARRVRGADLGAPGETYASFLEGYDRLARFIPRIAVYPLLVLPNTAYARDREALGLVTVRGDFDDYEYVAATSDISLADNTRMQRFLLWARGIVENLVLRNIWTPLHEMTRLRQSQVLSSMAEWFGCSPSPAAAGLHFADSAIGQPGAVLAFLRHVYSDPRIVHLLRQWWRDEIEPHAPEAARAFLTDVFEYDLATRPIYTRSRQTTSRWSSTGGRRTTTSAALRSGTTFRRRSRRSRRRARPAGAGADRRGPAVQGGLRAPPRQP